LSFIFFLSCFLVPVLLVLKKKHFWLIHSVVDFYLQMNLSLCSIAEPSCTHPVREWIRYISIRKILEHIYMCMCSYGTWVCRIVDLRYMSCLNK
jgi:hypothetical protein